MRKTNVIQLVKTFLADTVTPVVVLQHIFPHEHCFLLESVEGGEKWGRYSVLGFRPRYVIRHDEGRDFLELQSVEGVEIIDLDGDCLNTLRHLMTYFELKSSNKFSRFAGGMVGYLGYPLVSETENIPPARKPIDFPDLYLMIPEFYIVFDNIQNVYAIICNIFTERETEEDLDPTVIQKAREEIERIHQSLREPLKDDLPREETARSITLEAATEKSVFLARLQKIKDYICAGDIIQCVVSDRFRLTHEGHIDPIDIYRGLRYVNPSPYMFFLKFGDVQLIGASPEVMIRVEGKKLTLSPIAGTRKRGKDDAEDRRLADELLNDEKERAEHIMLVDLARNDAGRVSEIGSVQVTRSMAVERYSHVMHLVSCVESYLADDKDCFDALRSAFPAGTLSGAPKVRAMEIIQEMEDFSRGPYGGCVGYISFDGNMDTCITIRTLFRKGEEIFAQAGAGIVYDSVPEKEYEEIQNKIKGVSVSVKLAANGLNLDEGCSKCIS